MKKTQYRASSDGKRFEKAEKYVGVGAGMKQYRFTRPKQEKVLDKAQSLIRDFHYYQGLCKDVAYRKEVLRSIAAAEALEKERQEGDRVSAPERDVGAGAEGPAR